VLSGLREVRRHRRDYRPALQKCLKLGKMAGGCRTLLAMAGARIERADQVTGSYFWGAPPNYRGAEWPHGRRHQRLGEDEYPLVLVACLDLAAAHRFVPWLPESGRLLFFYDEEEGPWGDRREDREGWRVIYVRESDVLPGVAEAPAALGESAEMPPVHIDFTWIDSDDQGTQSSEVDEPCHQIGGLPRAVQSDEMPVMCQLLSNGFRLHNDPDLTEEIAEALEPGIADWRLLMQVDTDDDLPAMWGDFGCIYFWVREQEARVADFQNVWVLVQSH